MTSTLQLKALPNLIQKGVIMSDVLLLPVISYHLVVSFARLQHCHEILIVLLLITVQYETLITQA